MKRKLIHVLLLFCLLGLISGCSGQSKVDDSKTNSPQRVVDLDSTPAMTAVPATTTPGNSPVSTSEPTQLPTHEPSPQPTPEPTPQPTPEPTPEPTPQPTNNPAVCEYVLNKNTMKFHYPSCNSVKDIKDENRWDYTGTREEIIDMGYDPCKRCHP